MKSPDSLASLFSASASAFRLYTEEELIASRDAAMHAWQPGSDIWVFGYGSLIWRPEFDYEEKREALLRGYHRSLCLWSRINRGTPERPGLVLGLDAGGACKGVAYRVAGKEVPETMDALWRREMASGAYLPRWLNCATQKGRVQALVFVMDRSKPAYAQGLTAQQQAHIVLDAHGKYGPCTEYVLETVHALRAAGICDQKLESVVGALHASRPAEYTKASVAPPFGTP
ncbi:gamma-glutamylcyclotransferase [Pusillimonas sp. CC-YST705]|uniref:glutathione-specific gamma-glutamylcyclotransferase n=1 Tax=Mesopusillimonas faecipullorum TaxID=2755040 RepID=A0ABS8CEV3_9BURK|nr:gamma-glutamylcyclotransferase [Mesopusillimonas faecipullorum]MCB5364528.1 gamma-glutamylcyclotransferase [Mesopusillimonas faecipullorum]